VKTTVVASWLLAEATRLGASVAPGETPEARDARLGTITSSLATAARGAADGQGWTWTEIAAWGLIVWKEESQFDLRVHAGLPHPVWTSDVGRARLQNIVTAPGARATDARRTMSARWLSRLRLLLDSGRD
jgi:hypothetical protein